MSQMQNQVMMIKRIETYSFAGRSPSSLASDCRRDVPLSCEFALLPAALEPLLAPLLLSLCLEVDGSLCQDDNADMTEVLIKTSRLNEASHT